MQLHGELGAVLGGEAGAELLEFAQVCASAEPLARAGKDKRADRFVGVRCAQCIEQALGQRLVERIALLRPVHGEDADGAAVLDQERHREASLRRACSSSCTSRFITSAAGRISSTRPALCPASTLPHSTSPSSAACLSDEALKSAARSSLLDASNGRVKALRICRLGRSGGLKRQLSCTSAARPARLSFSSTPASGVEMQRVP